MSRKRLFTERISTLKLEADRAEESLAAPFSGAGPADTRAKPVML
jgi:hypothetical protein